MSDITQTCEVTGKTFAVNDWEQALLKRMDMPLPRLILEERHRRRMAHRNERSIYADQCDLCHKSTISMYSSEKKMTVYCSDCWWKDGWDARNYGHDFDFNRSFFEQFYELQLATPHLALINTKAENSAYCNVTISNKNCYLVFNTAYSEDSAYTTFFLNGKKCFYRHNNLQIHQNNFQSHLRV